MEIMALPSKEMWIFCDEISLWIKDFSNVNDSVQLKFADDTPKHVFDVFDSIKDKLEFKAIRV